MKCIHQFLGQPNNLADRKVTQKFFPEKIIIQPIQTHGNKIIEIIEENKNATIEADGIWTREKNIMLSIKTADCIAILLYHPQKKIVAAIHAGWRGLEKKICTEFLQKFTTDECNGFQVFISPSLQICCSEFSDPYNETPKFFHEYIEKRKNKFFINLSKICEQELIDCGVKRDNIENKYICTKCTKNKWWSHRNGNNQRNLSVIELV